MIAIFLIKAAERWTFGNVLGAAFLVSVAVLAGMAWWQMRR